MKKFLLTVSALSLLAACTAAPGNTTGNSSSSAMSTSSESSSETYTNTTKKFEIDYPSFLTVKEDDALVTDDFEVVGTSFAFPESYRDGNTLSDAKVNVSVVETCPAMQLTSSVMEQINGISFQKKDWSGVGAGNLYEGTTYSTVHGDSCYLMTLYTHSCNLGPDCSPGHTQTFDKEPLYDVFHSMMSTFKFL